MANTENYRVVGSSVQGQTLSRVILEGSVADPKRYADVGSDIELTDDEAASLRASGVKLRKSSDPEESSSGASSDDSSASPQNTPGGEVANQEPGAETPEPTSGTSRRTR